MLFEQQDQLCKCIKCYISIFIEVRFNIIKNSVKYFDK